MEPTREPKREPNRERRRLQAVAAALLLSAAVASGACTSDQNHEYLGHTDRVTSGAGDAVAANKAIHTIDPWPVYSQKTQIDMDGKRAAAAAKRYETNANGKQNGSAPDTSSYQATSKN
jgi:hypothetical protein